MDEYGDRLVVEVTQYMRSRPARWCTSLQMIAARSCCSHAMATIMCERFLSKIPTFECNIPSLVKYLFVRGTTSSQVGTGELWYCDSAIHSNRLVPEALVVYYNRYPPPDPVEYIGSLAAIYAHSCGSPDERVVFRRFLDLTLGKDNIPDILSDLMDASVGHHRHQAR